jgi:hypothetical protein
MFRSSKNHVEAAMTKLIRILLPAILVLGFATAAAAQLGGPCSGDSGCLPQNVYVDPNWDQMGTGANVTSCDAYRQFNGSCIDCVIPFAPRPGQPTGPSCQSVTYSASCTCDGTKCSTGQPGAVSGSCTYHP